jgi:hypothetical protein
LARRFIFFEFNDQLWWNLPFGIPLFFALSHLGMLFAVDATWLAYSSSSPPETETIHNIAKGHTALGAVYCAVQFIITLAMCAVIALHEDELARGAKRLFSKDFKPVSLFLF